MRAKGRMKREVCPGEKLGQISNPTTAWEQDRCRTLTTPPKAGVVSDRADGSVLSFGS